MPRDLSSRLQLKSGRALIVGAPDYYEQLLQPLPEQLSICIEDSEAPYSFIQLFVNNKQDLDLALEKYMHLFKADTLVWIAYPKKSSGLGADLNLMSSWDALSAAGMRPVSSVAIDDVWSSIRYKFNDQVKKSELCNDNIAQQYSAHIDMVNKKITLPDDISELLSCQDGALQRFNSFSYTRRKELLLSVLTAKQEGTRQKRLLKLLDACRD